MNSAIQYQGRKARRAGSEQRRRAILEAALRIIVREGIRSVRHRAVATEADVPLSATTYYFKDISDLIADTFTLFAERAMKEVIDPFTEQAFALLGNFDNSQLDDPERRSQLIDTLTNMTTMYLLDEVTNQRDHLIAEQAFMQEAVLDERLREMAQLYTEKQIRVLVKACEQLRTPQPKYDAELVLGSILRLEGNMLAVPEAIDQQEISNQVRHLLELLVGGRGASA